MGNAHKVKSVSKKYTKLFFITIAGMSLLVLGIALIMNFTRVGDRIIGFRSGEFINVSQDVYSKEWNFSARQANGHNTVFSNLSRDDLDNFCLKSSIGSGEVSLTISHGRVSKTFGLTEGEGEITAADAGMGEFPPGRTQMQLNLYNAEDIIINVSWR